MAFQTLYEHRDGTHREAKHNLFARQVFDESLDADIYVLTHLHHPNAGELPGSPRQRNWILYVCGWVSKARAAREGVYLPPGSLSERGRSWFDYRNHEIEFYNKNLNGFDSLNDLANLEPDDVKQDEQRRGGLNLTSVDAVRICYDLIGHGVLTEQHLEKLVERLGTQKAISPFLHANQYIHLAEWLQQEGVIGDEEMAKLQQIMSKQEFSGL